VKDDDTNWESDTGIVRRQISTDNDTVEVELLEIVAELEGVAEDELPSMYHELDQVVETLYETPPSTEAQMELSFSYAGYRIRMNQAGDVELVKVKDSIGR
jgi:hypothetical protein